MRTTAAWTLLALLTVGSHLARSEQAPPAPQEGAYEVEVCLELPHIVGAAAKKTTTVCLSEPGAGGGFAVLSDNNPLARCPASNIRRTGADLSYDIVCEGENAARASASFRLAPQGFRGRIAMRMGGKNMTMTETQIGRRVGPCP